ncbi:AraC-type DNA-binding protein [Succinivibrio dextrinosolvens]|uniref:helix-turn-helix domain-containing protein n=1 Tax=Succinivibrio dextrinosolvens TaxID=83771 RepID=UPI0008E88F12|nr:AraC family transcriptional regulator [Succinivibrio dextrinosolvens]SFS71048.1 AraC-type DNA-binding protein [Succinivibrio dextrinosolvens]
MENTQSKITDCMCATDASGLELVKHGTKNFPVGFYSKVPNSSEVPWHWHDHLELEYVEAGEARITIESMVFTVRKGEGFFVNSARLHAVFPDKDYISHTVVFHPSVISSNPESDIYRKYLEPLINGDSFAGLHLTEAIPFHRQLLSYTRSAFESYIKGDFGYEIDVTNSLSKAVQCLAYQVINTSENNYCVPDKSILRVKKMLAYLTQNLSEKIEIEDIARVARISTTECLRCFNKTVGMPPIQYLKKLRIQKAALLLGSSDDKIIDIALACGFSDMSYFARAFKESRGMSPKEYRNSVR